MLKRIKKALLKNPVTEWLLCALGALYILFVHLTSRAHYTIHPASVPYVNGDLPMIYSFWHGRLLMIPIFCPKKRRMHVIISSHDDGRLISRTVRFHGLRTVSGSSRRGGMQAARGAIEVLNKGENLCITPDGPKGPIHKIQPGVIFLARTTGIPIIPVTTAAKHAKYIESWDRFMLPRPFNHIHYFAGEPIIIPRDTDTDLAASKLERTMMTLLEKADHAAQAS